MTNDQHVVEPLPKLYFSILSQDKDSKEIKEIRRYYLKNYPLLEYLSINNNLTQHCQYCYIKSSCSEGFTAKEPFIRSKSGRAGIISTSLNTSSTGYMQRELAKSMEDLITDKEGIILDYNNDEIYYYPFSTSIPDIDDSFL
ncbi:hypothetical protein BCR36DRAFT_369319 [Piromyces finnis]|uniref:DNA-directed RNA polymerase n=1 Tax=Piromyces finnis TaxID=1754191 RepID=A0A1Y1VDC6_9FUNG|nr:hypothetical protein BCR36DRAFT_369319 [Piromyces finnis]|eukprot:ORX52520.1 hypothetical protein BCR36DRAFT_369319 [Piromyces finnis]